MKKIILLITHLLAVAGGFSLGVYLLPILTAPAAPTSAEVQSRAGQVAYTAQFRRDLKGSDLLHWGEGHVSLSSTAITLMGDLAPGPAYKLYLTPELVEDEAGFAQIKNRSLPLGDIKTFDNFVVEVPEGVDLSQYKAVVVWCEAFSEFITAGAYQ